MSAYFSGSQTSSNHMTSLSTNCSGGSDSYESFSKNTFYASEDFGGVSAKSVLPSSSKEKKVKSDEIDVILCHLNACQKQVQKEEQLKTVANKTVVSSSIAPSVKPSKINVIKLSNWVVNDLWKDAFEIYAVQHPDAQYLQTCSFYFEDNKRVKIAFAPYVKRLKDMTECSDNCFLLALLLFDRLNKNKRLHYTRLNVHKLMAVCLWLSVKFYEDINYPDSYFAEKISGIPLKELISLQFELLELLDYRLLISIRRFNHFVTLIQSIMESSALLA